MRHTTAHAYTLSAGEREWTTKERKREKERERKRLKVRQRIATRGLNKGSSWDIVPCSMVQFWEQPSEGTRLPSSHLSRPFIIPVFVFTFVCARAYECFLSCVVCVDVEGVVGVRMCWCLSVFVSVTYWNEHQVLYAPFPQREHTEGAETQTYPVSTVHMLEHLWKSLSRCAM